MRNAVPDGAAFLLNREEIKKSRKKTEIFFNFYLLFFVDNARIYCERAYTCV